MSEKQASELKIEFTEKYLSLPLSGNDEKQEHYQAYSLCRDEYIKGTKELNKNHIFIQNEITWAMNDYGVILYNSGHIDEAKEIWKKSAKIGDPYACDYLFFHFKFKENIRKQLYYTEKSIENGNFENYFYLFKYYYNIKDYTTSNKYMKKYIQAGGRENLFNMILKTNNNRSNNAENYTNNRVESLKNKVEITHRRTNKIIMHNFEFLIIFFILFCIMNFFVIIQNIINYNTLENFHVLNIWISCFVNGISIIVSIIMGCLFNTLFEENKKNKDL